jgi:hypothetical protein
LASAIALILSAVRSTTEYQTGAAAILFPEQKTASRREYLASAMVWPLEGNLTVAFKAVEGNVKWPLRKKSQEAASIADERRVARLIETENQNEGSSGSTVVSENRRALARYRRSL